MSTQFNQHTSLPYIPYNITVALFSNENLWKLLYYPTLNCLDEDDLTIEQKSAMVWSGEDQQQDYFVFFTPLLQNMIYESKTVLKIFNYDITPNNNILSTIAMEFDIITGGKVVLAKSNGIVCNRVDLIKMELLKTLNGLDVSGVGVLQFNTYLSSLCNSRSGVGNDRTFTGANIVFATQISNLSQGSC